MSKRSPRNRLSVYKFALYGVPASGKTCVLAALAAPRVANPRKYTCAWIDQPHDDPAPPKGRSNSAETDEPQPGDGWFKRQLKRLEEGEPPEATPPGAGLMRLRYDFSAPERGAFSVEIVDYSGELLTLKSDELAERLREHMRDRDGVIILAEAPRPGADAAPLTRDFSRLAEAFHELLAEKDDEARREFPVAVLLNKWDRRGPIDFDDHEAERRKLDEFLTSSPDLPHRGLVDAVRNFVSEANALILPVSAFGESRIDNDGGERPQMAGPLLRSFGLEDPFVQLASRRDELELQRFENAATTCSPWRFWDLAIGQKPTTIDGDDPARFRGHSPWRCLAAGRRLRGRFVKGSPEDSRLRAGLRTLRGKLGTQAVTGLIALILMSLTVEAIVDGARYRQVGINKANPGLALASALDDENWLESYAKSRPYRHVFARLAFLPRGKAATDLTERRAQRDDASWKDVEQAPDDRIKADRADEYLENHPQGKWRTEATGFSNAGKILKNHDHLEEIRGELKTLNGNGPEAEAKAQDMWKRIDSLPHPSFVNEELAQEQASLRSSIQARLTEIAAKIDADKKAKSKAENLDYLKKIKVELDALVGNDEKVERKVQDMLKRLDDPPNPAIRDDDVNNEVASLRERLFTRLKGIQVAKEDEKWREFHTEILSLLGEKELVEAAEKLARQDPNDPRVKTLRAVFAEQCAPLVREQVELNLKRQDWSEARRIWRENQNHKAVRNLLSDEQLKDVDSLGPKINESEDRYAYEQLLKNPTRARSFVDAYLNLSPPGRMNKEVLAYRDYLDKIAGPLDLKLSLQRIDWGESANGYTHEIQVTVDGQPWIDTSIKAYPRERAERVGPEKSIKKRLNEEINIHTRVIQKGWWWIVGSDASAGDRAIRAETAALKNGMTVKLDGTDQGNKATFLVVGFPDAPPLPPLREK